MMPPTQTASGFQASIPSEKAPDNNHCHADHKTDKVADESTHQSERGKSHSLFLSFTHLLDISRMLRKPPHRG